MSQEVVLLFDNIPHKRPIIADSLFIFIDFVSYRQWKYENPRIHITIGDTCN